MICSEGEKREERERKRNVRHTVCPHSSTLGWKEPGGSTGKVQANDERGGCIRALYINGGFDVVYYGVR